jgi:hypothetical protein
VEIPDHGRDPDDMLPVEVDDQAEDTVRGSGLRIVGTGCGIREPG